MKCGIFFLLVFSFALLFIGCGSRAAKSGDQLSKDEAKWDICHSQEVATRDENRAIECFESLCAEKEPSARACYDAARLLFELGRTAEAREATVRFVRDFRENALGPPLLKKLKRSFAANESERGIALFNTLANDTKGSGIRDSVLFERADLERRAGLGEQEISTLSQLIDEYGRWQSQLWDDALWRLIEIRRGEGKYEEEARLLDRLLGTRESSRFIGSYNSPFHDDALLRRAELYMSKGDHDRAYATYQALAENKTSRLKDEGLLGAAQAEVGKGEKQRACLLLKRLRVEMADSSSARQAASLWTKWGCS